MDSESNTDADTNPTIHKGTLPDSPVSVFIPDWLSLSEHEPVEEIVWTHPSLFKYAKGLFTSVVMVLFGLYLGVLDLIGSPALSGQFSQLYMWTYLSLIVFGIGLILFDFAKYYSTYYIVTSTRVIKKTTILNKNPNSTRISQIQNIDMYQLNFGVDELLGYGRIDISTAGSDGRDLFLPFVPAPSQFVTEINNHMYDQEEDEKE